MAHRLRPRRRLVTGAPLGARVGSVRAMLMRPAQRFALEVYRRLPVQARRAVVRMVAPTYTAGAIAVVERSDGAILLVRQVYRNNWGLPGGLLEKGEAPVEAVVREVREELGLAITVHGRGAVVLDVTPRRFDFVYRATVDGDETEALRPRSAEIQAAAWFSPDDLPALQFESATALDVLASGAHDVPYVPDRRDRSGEG